MIIRELYQTKIEITQGTTGNSYYNVNIDSTDALVTVTLLDFNGNPVKNKNVTLNVDKGFFTQKGTSADSQYTFNSADNSKSITVSTGDNGKIHGVYTASEWGLCTFSVNNTKIQLLVNNSAVYNAKTELGFNTSYITANDSIFYLTRVGNLVSCQCHLVATGGAALENNTLYNILNGALPAQFRPRNQVTVAIPDISDVESLINNNTSSQWSVGALTITTAGEVKLRKLLKNKGPYNYHLTFTYAV